MKKLFLRVRQFGRSVTARPLDDDEKEYIGQILLAGQLALFEALPTYEQRHALNVCRTLVGGGYGPDRELLQAALLHDLGKYDPTAGRVIPIWVKVANVALTTTLGAKSVTRLARQAPVGHWRYYFWLQTRHETEGARRALSAGSSPRVVALVAGGNTLGDYAARVLQWADDLN